jgi:NADP-reducing hydrogenase subunit HndC
VDPERIDDSIALDGYLALERVLLELDPRQVLDIIKRSGLRGRGGAGFPTGFKWQFVRESPGEEKYVVCNADESDPGAFMDRALLEGDPHSIIEAMTIAGRAVGAGRGIVFLRAEYPLALHRLGIALGQARAYGLLGPGILGSDFEFDIEIRLGGGAFVCGEETALVQSIEGKRSLPRPRPPFPAEKGLWGRPTLINNVETLANVPPIFLRGPEWYASVGTARSTGTKVFALGGALRNTGLVEVPLGTPLREVVEVIGGGVSEGRTLKAVQPGGPTGGCIPASLADTAIGHESFRQVGAIIGSGGLIALDDRTCMVDFVRFLLEFLVAESCGKCPPCRVGIRIMLNLVEGIARGEGSEGDLETLESLGRHVEANSLCGLGQTAPSALLSSLDHFREEFLVHIYERRCPAARCASLLTYTVDEALCDGCGLCADACPASAIEGQPHHAHHVNQEHCIRCGACLTACPPGAVDAR